jgi:hypothetical protein
LPVTQHWVPDAEWSTPVWTRVIVKVVPSGTLIVEFGEPASETGLAPTPKP